ncbi:MAG TPA: tetratricopeptide repeat protein [Thermoanaerobaculia bacterium]
MRTRLLAAIATIALTTISPLYADDRSDCTGSQNHDVVMAACGRLIASETETAEIKAVAYANKALAFQRQGNFDAAIAELDQAITLNPKLSALYFNRGVMHYRKEDAKKAVADFTEAIRLDPTDLQPLVNRAIVAFDGDDYAHALADMDAAIKLSPKTPMLFTYRAKIQLGAGNAERAIADFKQVLKLDPANEEAKAMLKDLGAEQK